MILFISISSFINGIFAIICGLLVLFHNPKRRVNQLLFLMSLSVFVWGVSFGIAQLSEEKTSALFWVEMLNFGAIFIPIFFLHWILSLLRIEKEKINKVVLILGYLITLFFVLFAFTPYFVTIKPKPYFFFYSEPGIFHPFYLFFSYFGLVGYALYNLFKSYKQSNKYTKTQIKYVLLGATLGFGGGATTFLLFYNIPIPPIGNPLVAVGFGLLAYSVVRHHLMDIKILSVELFTSLIWILLFIRTILSKTSEELLMNVGLLISVIIIGTLLIRSVFKEVKQKEELEKLNEDLKKAYETEKKDKQRIKEMGEKLLETERKIKEDIQYEAGETAKRFDNYFMRNENLDKLKLKQEILMLVGKVKELEKELEKAEKNKKRKV